MRARVAGYGHWLEEASGRVVADLGMDQGARRSWRAVTDAVLDDDLAHVDARWVEGTRSLVCGTGRAVGEGWGLQTPVFAGAAALNGFYGRHDWPR